MTNLNSEQRKQKSLASELREVVSKTALPSWAAEKIRPAIHALESIAQPDPPAVPWEGTVKIDTDGVLHHGPHLEDFPGRTIKVREVVEGEDYCDADADTIRTLEAKVVELSAKVKRLKFNIEQAVKSPLPADDEPRRWWRNMRSGRCWDRKIDAMFSDDRVIEVVEQKPGWKMRRDTPTLTREFVLEAARRSFSPHRSWIHGHSEFTKRIRDGS